MSQQYVVGSVPHYREGRLYKQGDVVTLAEGEQPSRTWTKYEAPAPAPKAEAEGDDKADKAPKKKTPSVL